jgi:hypothetical protein
MIPEMAIVACCGDEIWLPTMDQLDNVSMNLGTRPIVADHGKVLMSAHSGSGTANPNANSAVTTAPKKAARRRPFWCSVISKTS